jgi:integrase
MVEGKRHTFSLKGCTRAQAEDVARQKYEALQRRTERAKYGLPVSTRFSEVLALYEKDELPTLATGTQASYNDSLKPIRQYFVELRGDPEIEQIRPPHIKQYLSWRRTHNPDGTERKKPLHLRTVEKDRAVLHRLFSLAVELEMREGNPVALVKRPKYDKRQPVILSDEQYEKLIEKCGDNDMLRLYVLVLGEAGLRSQSEALYLRWEDLDLEGGFLNVVSGRSGHRTKSGKSRWVPLTTRLKDALRDHAAAYRLQAYHGCRSPWVFHHRSDGTNRGAGDRIGTLRKALRSTAKRAELPPAFRLHDLRHRRVTTWLAEARNPVHVKEALGHSDLRITMDYTHLAREHLRSLVEDDGLDQSVDQYPTQQTRMSADGRR